MHSSRSTPDACLLRGLISEKAEKGWGGRRPISCRQEICFNIACKKAKTMQLYREEAKERVTRHVFLLICAASLKLHSLAADVDVAEVPRK